MLATEGWMTGLLLMVFCFLNKQYTQCYNCLQTWMLSCRQGVCATLHPCMCSILKFFLGFEILARNLNIAKLFSACHKSNGNILHHCTMFWLDFVSLPVASACTFYDAKITVISFNDCSCYFGQFCVLISKTKCTHAWVTFMNGSTWLIICATCLQAKDIKFSCSIGNVSCGLKECKTRCLQRNLD